MLPFTLILLISGILCFVGVNSTCITNENILLQNGVRNDKSHWEKYQCFICCGSRSDRHIIPYWLYIWNQDTFTPSAYTIMLQDQHYKAFLPEQKLINLVKVIHITMDIMIWGSHLVASLELSPHDSKWG